MNNSGIEVMYEYNCLVLPDPVEEVTKGGIILAQTTQEKKKYETQRATFIMASGLAFSDPNWPVVPIPGDRVYVTRHSGFFHKGDDGLDYKIVNDKDIVAKLKE
jgi:co-chaperonin GroES (HSP10)